MNTTMTRSTKASFRPRHNCKQFDLALRRSSHNFFTSHLKDLHMSAQFIHVEVILPSQERASQSLNINYIVAFNCSQGVFTEVVMTRGMYIVDMPYEEFLALLNRVIEK